MLIGFAALAVVLASPTRVDAATRTWDGGGLDNNWSTAANWSSDTLPVAGDTVTFNGTSTKDAAIDVPVTVAVFQMNAGFTGTITQTNTLTLTASYTQSSGTFVGGGAALAVTGSTTVNSGAVFNGGGSTITLTGALTVNAGGAFTSTSATLTVTGAVTLAAGVFSHNGGTVVFATSNVTLNLGGAATFNNVQFASGTKTISAANTMTVLGTLTMTSGSLSTGTLAAQGSISTAGGFTGGTATLLINGAGAQLWTGGAIATSNLPIVIINKPGGTLTMTGTLRTTRNWTWTAGTVDAATSTVIFAGTQTISGSHSLGAVEIRGGTITIAAGTILTATGAVNLFSGSLGTGTLAAQGDVDAQIGYTGGGTATLLINGAGSQTLTGFHTSATGSLPHVDVNKPSGTLTIAGTLRTARNWTYTGGGLTAAGSTLVFNGTQTITGSHTLDSVEVRGGTLTIAAGTTLTATGALNLFSGSLSTGTLAAQGSIDAQVGYTGGGTATLLISGAGSQTLTGFHTPAAGSLPNLVIDKPSGTLTIAGTLRTGRSWTYLNGALITAGSTVIFNGTLTITGDHSLDAVELHAGNVTVAPGDNLTVMGLLTLTDGNLNGGTIEALGDISLLATFDGETGTILVAGTADQTWTGSANNSSSDLANVVIDKPSGTLFLVGTIRMTTASWTWLNGVVDPGTSTVYFDTTVTIVGTHSLFNVYLSGGAHTVAGGDTLTAFGTLTLDNGTINGGTIAAAGPIGQLSTFDGGTGMLEVTGTADQTFNGTATFAAGNLPDLQISKAGGTLILNGTIRTANDWTHIAGAVDPDGSIVVLAGALAVDATGMSFNDLRVASGTATLTSNLTVNGDLTVAAGTLAIGSNTVSVAGDVTIDAGLTVTTGTLSLDGLAGQILGGAASIGLYDLTINDPAGVTQTTGVAVAGTLDLGGPLDFSGETLSISHTIIGVPNDLTADAAATLVINGSGSGIVVPSSLTTLRNLSITNVNGAALAGPLTVDGTLTLAGGNLDAGSDVLSIGPVGTVNRTSGHVIGALQKWVAAGSGVTATFEIGDATTYAPVSMTFGMVAIPGQLVASTTAGEHPNIGTAPIYAPRDLNRWWKLTNNGVGFDLLEILFTFAAADIDPGAQTGQFIVAKWDGAWTVPTSGANTATAITAYGMTSLSEFAIGETLPQVSVTAVPAPIPTPVGALADTRATEWRGDISPLMLLAVFAGWFTLVGALAAESAWRGRTRS
jgi:hypothetical protein